MVYPEVLKHFLQRKEGRIILNGKSRFSPKGPFWIDLSYFWFIRVKWLNSHCRLFEEDVFLFSVDFNLIVSFTELHNSFQCKISFNADLINQVKEVIFNQKFRRVSDPSIPISINPLNLFSSQMHLGWTSPFTLFKIFRINKWVW